MPAAVSEAETAPEQIRRTSVSPVAGLVMIVLDRGRRVVVVDADAAALTRVLDVLERRRPQSRRLLWSQSPQASPISSAELASLALSVQDGLGRNSTLAISACSGRSAATLSNASGTIARGCRSTSYYWCETASSGRRQ